jgi:glutathione reductase (NADPH)
MNELPKKVVMVGASYIAMELSGIWNGLGSNTHWVVRKHKAIHMLFDKDISDPLDFEMQQHHKALQFKVVLAEDGTKIVHLLSEG